MAASRAAEELFLFLLRAHALYLSMYFESIDDLKRCHHRLSDGGHEF